MGRGGRVNKQVRTLKGKRIQNLEKSDKMKPPSAVGSKYGGQGKRGGRRD